MFVDKMTSVELLDEYHADLPEIRERTLTFDQSSYVTQYLKRNRNKSRVVLTQKIRTSRGNNYLGVLIYRSNNRKEWEWNAVHVGLMNTDKGLMVLAFYDDLNAAIAYTPHFFRRYKERLMKVCDWQTRLKLQQASTTEDIATIFIKRNPNATCMKTESEFGKRIHVFTPTPDGVALLQINTELQTLQANTFITMDMLSNKQKEMIEEAERYKMMNAVLQNIISL